MKFDLRFTLRLLFFVIAPYVFTIWAWGWWWLLWTSIFLYFGFRLNLRWSNGVAGQIISVVLSAIAIVTVITFFPDLIFASWVWGYFYSYLFLFLASLFV